MSDRVRVTFEIPKKLLEFIDDVCAKKSTEIMRLTRSSYLRKLIIEDRDGKKEQKHLKWELPKERIRKQEEIDTDEDCGYDDLLDLSGYKRS